MNHTAIIHWTLQGPDFLAGRYSREHTWIFDGGVTVPASPSPHIVPAPWSNAAGVDPEEAFVAAVASCHMLWFLHMAKDAGYIVARYEDRAEGEMTRNEQGKLWVSRVTLRPLIAWTGGEAPNASVVAELHHRAHDECFIAKSIRTEVVTLPV